MSKFQQMKDMYKLQKQAKDIKKKLKNIHIEAEEEGVMIHWLRTIKQIDETIFTVEKMEIDENGRPQPIGEFETIEADDSCILSSLIEKGASLQHTNPRGRRPLHHAIEFQSGNCLEVLLEAGANPEARDQDGLTPVHLAAASANQRAFQILLKNGADPTAISTQGRTILHFGLSGNFKEAVQQGLRLGLDPDYKDLNGVCATQLASDLGLQNWLSDHQGSENSQ